MKKAIALIAAAIIEVWICDSVPLAAVIQSVGGAFLWEAIAEMAGAKS
ncbi:MAG TPA: hypothetical protein VGC34_14665 [Steroidobacteraceae bacterium]